jgi:hypothetical protein
MEDTIAGGWEAYSRDVRPTEEERERLREAFYSGAFAGHFLTLTALLGNEKVCVKKIDDLREELKGVGK